MLLRQISNTFVCIFPLASADLSQFPYPHRPNNLCYTKVIVTERLKWASRVWLILHWRNTSLVGTQQIMKSPTLGKQHACARGTDASDWWSFAAPFVTCFSMCANRFKNTSFVQCVAKKMLDRAHCCYVSVRDHACVYCLPDQFRVKHTRVYALRNRYWGSTTDLKTKRWPWDKIKANTISFNA